MSYRSPWNGNPAKYEWLCDCGCINGLDEQFCWSCGYDEDGQLPEVEAEDPEIFWPLAEDAQP
jgi:hypothetical protein